MPNANEQLTDDLNQIENNVQNTNDNSEHVETKVENEPQLVNIPDDHIVEVLVDGEPVRMPWKEAKASVMRQADYTRKTQGVSAKVKEVNELYTGLTAKQKELMEKEAAIDAILGRTSRTPQSTEMAADEVLTYGQIKELMAKEREELTKTLRGELTSTVEKTEQERTFARWEERTEELVEAIQQEHDVLQDIPHLSAILKREALKVNPQTEKEMLKAIKDVGKGLADKLNKRYQDKKKADAIKRTNLVKKGPEPSGGVPQFTTNKTYGKNRQINWSELEGDAIAAFDSE